MSTPPDAEQPDLAYLDGAEGYLAEVLQRASDRSSASDELQAAIVDWPSEYHLSSLRANLLRPLELGPETSVLDVGAGTGALARYLGEVCGRVVALEGSRARADVARVRCQDQANVEVRHGTLEDLGPDERFDVVLICGVLEYTGADIGGGRGPHEMLRRATAALAEGGIVAVAIENQLGLKYLLGAPEDHRAAPWVGIDDYPGPPGVRTWPRAELAAMLSAAGLVHHRWLLPFPDYKLPTVVLDEALYREPDAPALVEQLLPRPVRVSDGVPERLADASAAHGVLVRAGLGVEVASSFLVLASPDPAAPARWARPDALAWLYGSRRLSPWRRTRVLTRDRVLQLLDAPGTRERGWLLQEPGADRPYVTGATLGQQARAAVRRHDLDALATVLRRWRDALAAEVSTATDDGGDRPFGAAPGEPALPSTYLDASLDNFVDHDGALRFVDDEWRTTGPVNADVAYARALWVLARDLVESGIEHPWGHDASVQELVDALADLTGQSIPAGTIDRWRAAEHELQGLVAGASPEHLAATWTNGATTSAELRVDVQRQRAIERLTARVAELEAHEAALADEVRLLREQREDLFRLGLDYQRTIAELEAALAEARTVRGFLTARRP